MFSLPVKRCYPSDLLFQVVAYSCLRIILLVRSSARLFFYDISSSMQETESSKLEYSTGVLLGAHPQQICSLQNAPS
jgi:hypothetical protein